MEDLKAGDVVVLKSKSVAMTITSIYGGDDGKSYADCVWFDNAQYNQQTIPVVALKKQAQSSSSRSVRVY